MTSKEAAAKINGCWVKVSAHSITAKDDDGKTRGVIRCEPMSNKSRQPNHMFDAVQALSRIGGLNGQLGRYLCRMSTNDYLLLLNINNRTAEQMQRIEWLENALAGSNITPVRVNESQPYPYIRPATYGGEFEPMK